MSTTTLTTTPVPRGESGLLAAARALAPELSARGQEAETLGTMPADLVARVREAGLFRAVQPRALGGFELAPAPIVELVEELSRADGSAGWTVMIGNGAPAFAAWLDPTVARDLLGGDADFASASVFAPTGQALPDGAGRFAVDGRWAFASGCRHAEWFANGVFVFDGDVPRMLPDRGPDWRLAFFPRSAAEIIDNWDVAGLRGTGSNDVAVRDLTVHEEHTISPFFEPARHEGALWRLPFFTLIGVTLVGFPLGVARRALDEFTELATTKLRAGSFEPVAQDPAAQVELARAEGSLQAARAFVFDTIAAVWDTASAGDVPSIEQRARLQLAAQQAMRAAVEVVDVAFNLAGAGAVRSSHPLQRCFRDLHVANQHIYFSTAALKRYAKTRFDISQPTFMM
jgi:indole-3-acetate monooxygenase